MPELISWKRSLAYDMFALRKLIGFELTAFLAFVMTGLLTYELIVVVQEVFAQVSFATAFDFHKVLLKM